MPTFASGKICYIEMPATDMVAANGDDIDPETWAQVIDLNLTSVFLMLKTFLPEMIERRRTEPADDLLGPIAQDPLRPDVPAGDLAVRVDQMAQDDPSPTVPKGLGDEKAIADIWAADASH